MATHWEHNPAFSRRQPAELTEFNNRDFLAEAMEYGEASELEEPCDNDWVIHRNHWAVCRYNRLGIPAKPISRTRLVMVNLKEPCTGPGGLKAGKAEQFIVPKK